MRQFQYEIKLKMGMHARPSALLAQRVQDVDSTVTLEFEGNVADASKMPFILGLKLKKGDVVTVKVEGSDEETAAVKLEQIFKENF